MRIHVFVVTAISAFVSLQAHASTIELWKQSGTTFEYNLDTPEGTFQIERGHSIVFTGLKDVTGANTRFSNLYATSFTGTTATFTLAYVQEDEISDGTFYDFFDIISSASLGTGVSYGTTGLQAGYLSGTVDGPTGAAAAPTPEPSSLALLGTGVLALFGAARRRLA